MPASPFPWFVTGMAVFGLMIGLLVGLSLTPVVNTVIGLLFAFIGGSIIVLIKGRTEAELSAIGQSVTTISCFMIFGMIVGILLRNGYFFQSEPKVTAPFVLEEKLTISDLKTLGAKPGYSEAICQLVKLSVTDGKSSSLSRVELIELVGSGVAPGVILAMISGNYSCSPKVDSKGTGEAGDSNNQGQNPRIGFYLFSDEDGERISGEYIPLPNFGNDNENRD